VGSTKEVLVVVAAASPLSPLLLASLSALSLSALSALLALTSKDRVLHSNFTSLALEAAQAKTGRINN
jgi:hypothetical protein